MITPKELALEIVRVAKSNPDRIYSTGGPTENTDCYYSWNEDKTTEEGCIVGQALLNLGVPREILRQIDSCGGTAFRGIISGHYAVPQHLLSLYYDMGEGEADPWNQFISGAQEFQDCGETWINSVKEAAGVLPDDLKREVLEILNAEEVPDGSSSAD